VSDRHALVARLHREAPLTDVHAHPSLKAYLFGRNLWRHYGSGGAFNPFASRTDFPSLDRGGVGIVWAAHYVPESEIFRDCWLAGAAARLSGAYGRLTKGTPFERLFAMMAALEREIARAPNQAELARSCADLERIRADRKIAVVHAVEGAHVLAGDAERVGDLAAAGVAMITLTHFYANGLAAHVDGVPRDMWLRKVCSFDFGLDGPALTDTGRAMLAATTKHRMLVRRAGRRSADRREPRRRAAAQSRSVQPGRRRDPRDCAAWRRRRRDLHAVLAVRRAPDERCRRHLRHDGARPGGRGVVGSRHDRNRL
jgi:hypothetical protein